MQPRKTIFTLAMLGAGMLLGGCDREVSHETKVKVSDGEVKTKETIVTESPQGNVKVQEKTTESEDGKTTTETKTTEYKAP